jgi:hypothetical protein
VQLAPDGDHAALDVHHVLDHVAEEPKEAG